MIHLHETGRFHTPTPVPLLLRHAGTDSVFSGMEFFTQRRMQPASQLRPIGQGCFGRLPVTHGRAKPPGSCWAAGHTVQGGGFLPQSSDAGGLASHHTPSRGYLLCTTLYI